MKRSGWFGPRTVALALLVIGAHGLANPPLAAERSGYSVEILVDGRPVQEHWSDGTLYIEALKGRNYAVRLRNQTAERVAVALAVDGLNSIDARETTARDAAKWILDPWQSLTIEGWQTGLGTARRFVFTTEERSYGAWLGRTRNLGIVSAAFFRERRPVRTQGWFDGGRLGSRRDGNDDTRGGDEESAGGPARAPEARLGDAGPGHGSAGAAERAETFRENEAPRGPDPYGEDRQRKSELSGKLAATGIGREIIHRVRQIHFDNEAVPAVLLDLRYEYRDALVKLGVFPVRCGMEDPRARRETARGFEQTSFAPDPYQPEPRCR